MIASGETDGLQWQRAALPTLDAAYATQFTIAATGESCYAAVLNGQVRCVPNPAVFPGGPSRGPQSGSQARIPAQKRMHCAYVPASGREFRLTFIGYLAVVASAWSDGFAVTSIPR